MFIPPKYCTFPDTFTAFHALYFSDLKFYVVLLLSTQKTFLICHGSKRWTLPGDKGAQVTGEKARKT